MWRIICLVTTFLTFGYGFSDPSDNTSEAFPLEYELEIQDSYTFHLFKCEEAGNFPHPLNCKLFYECSLYKHGRYRRFLRKCKIGFVFSTNLGKCTYPQESGRSECIGKGILTTPSPPTKRPSSKITKVPTHRTTTRKNKTHLKTTILPTLPPKIECLAEGFMAHPTDCAKYYVCIARIDNTFQVFEMKCKLGTIWDREKEICSHRWKVRNPRCGPYITDEPTTRSTKDVTKSTQRSTHKLITEILTSTSIQQTTGLTTGIVTQTSPHSVDTEATVTIPPSSTDARTDKSTEPVTQTTESSTPKPMTETITHSSVKPSTTLSTSPSTKVDTETRSPSSAESSTDLLIGTSTESLTEIADVSTSTPVTQKGSSSSEESSTDRASSTKIDPSVEPSTKSLTSTSTPVGTITAKSSTLTTVTEAVTSSSVKPATDLLVGTSTESVTGTSGLSTSTSEKETVRPSSVEPSTDLLTSTSTSAGTVTVEHSTLPPVTQTVTSSSLKPATDLLVGTTTESVTGTSGLSKSTPESETLRPSSLEPSTDLLTSTSTPRSTVTVEHSTLIPVTQTVTSSLETSTYLSTASNTNPLTETADPSTHSPVTETRSSSSINSSTAPSRSTTSESVPETTDLTTHISLTESGFTTSPESSTNLISVSTVGTISSTIESSTNLNSVKLSSTSESPMDKTVCTTLGFFPNPNDCSKFFRCVQVDDVFTRIDFVCPDETVWDQELLRCNSVSVSHSNCKNSPPDIDDEPDMSGDDNMCPIGKLSGDQIALVCPTGFRKHPKYCNIFYQCTSESNLDINIALFACPEGTIYNHNEMQCVFASTANYRMFGCKNVLLNPMANLVPILTVPSTQLCPSEGSFSYHPGCSNAYFKCKRNRKGLLQGYLYKCPVDYVFSPFSRTCEPAKYFPLCLNPTQNFQTNSSSSGLYLTHHNIFYIGKQLS
ncbi:P cell-type agglutination protein map4-like [Vespula pensylvanica]|uniref:P cell-type agglutination protein map4-like n=1 Tax=Vespula pensylvanica TaxID=30213 RepID=UPI001CB9DC31|nr:P cell-type agglutination protein map4-like [Vespula pensylvanica]